MIIKLYNICFVESQVHNAKELRLLTQSFMQCTSIILSLMNYIIFLTVCSRLISVTVVIHSQSLCDVTCPPTLGLLSRWRHQDPSKPWQ